VLKGPAVHGLAVYEVQEIDGDVQVRV